MAQVYYQDYNSDTTGNLPANWEVNNATYFTPIISTSNVFEGAKCVQLKKEIGSPTGDHWFAIDTVNDPATGDYEVEATVFFDDDTTLRSGVIFRGKNAATNEGYAMMLRGTTSLRFSYINGVTETVKVTAVISAYSLDTHYHIKAYANGTAIKGRYWADGGAEPSTWDIDTTDATLDNTNHLVGAYLFNGSNDADDVFFDVLEANDFNTTTIKDAVGGLGVIPFNR